MHRELAPEVVIAAAHVHEHAELVRRRVDVRGDGAAVDGLEAGRAGDGDVLAELRGQLDTLLFELRRRIDPSASTRSSTFLPNAWNSSLFATGSVSQPTATIVPRDWSSASR